MTQAQQVRSESGPRSPQEHVRALVRLMTEAGAGPSAESVRTGETLGRVVAHDVPAPFDSPRFDNSQMDGYALSAEQLELIAREPDGSCRSFRAGPALPAGTPAASLYPAGLEDPEVVCPVMTGAEMPAGGVAVVPVERCRPPEFAEEGRPVDVPSTSAETFVRRAGSDLLRGQTLLEAGTLVNPQTIGAAASQGLSELPVRRRPRILVCTGGDEIVRPEPSEPSESSEQLRPDDAGAAEGEDWAPVIPDANGPLLRALAREHGAQIAGLLRTGDDPAVLGEELRAAVREMRPDLVVTSGGISHGKFEVVRQALGGLPGSWFGHVSQQPGGPQGHAVLEGTPVVCLPGNPVSTWVSFRMLLLPALCRVFGAVPEPVSLDAVLEERVRGIPGKTRYLRARAHPREGRLNVRPVGGPGSHLLAQAVPANALLEVPPGADLPLGSSATIHLLGGMAF